MKESKLYLTNNNGNALLREWKGAASVTLLDLLPNIRSIARGVAVMFGPNCEVVVHDFSQLDSSIVHIENGHITGRRTGDTLTNLGLAKLQEGAADNELINYSTRAPDGRQLRSTSIFLRDKAGKAVGAFCINFDIAQVDLAVQILQSLTGAERRLPEEFTGDVNSLLEQLIQQAADAVGKPLLLMSRDDKLKALAFLENKGAFLIKRSVDKVAATFDLSRFTVYAYLDQIRTRSNDPVS